MAKAKLNAVMTWTFDIGHRTLTCAIKDGDTRTFEINATSPAVREMALINGFRQRLADAAALDKGATPAEKQAEVWALMDHYETGTYAWARKSAGGGGGVRLDVGLVVQAICNVRTAGDVDKANALIDGIATKRSITRDEAAKVWLGVAEIGEQYAILKARRDAAKSSVDADDLEMELMGE